MHIPRAKWSSTSSVGTKPGASTTSPSPSSAIWRSTSGRSGPSPRIAALSRGTRLRARAIAGGIAGTCFSGMWRPAKTTSGSAPSTGRTSSGPSYSPGRIVTSPDSPSSRSRSAYRREKQNARWGTRAHRSCTSHPMSPPKRPRYSRQYRRVQTSCQSTTSRYLHRGRAVAAANREKYGNDAVWTTS